MIKSYCPHCGNVFQSNAFNLGGNIKSVNLRGNRETCPRCGKLANIEDGVFDVVDGILRKISETNFSSDDLRSLASLMQAISTDPSRTGQLPVLASSINPAFKGLLEPILQKGSALGFILLLIATILTNSEFKLEATVDINRLIEQAMEMARPQKNEGDAGATEKQPENTVSLPRVGPVPKRKPQSLNRKNRRREAAMARADVRSKPRS